MTTYLDASVLVAFIVDEARGAEIGRWLASRPTKPIVSVWCVTEVSSALAKKVRTGYLPAEKVGDARRFWASVLESLLTVVPVDPADFHAAADLCARPELVLRGPDALHLAVVRRLGLGLATFDQGMADAATALRIPLAAPGLASR